VLDWRPQAEAYVGVYDDLFGYEPEPAGRSTVVRAHRRPARTLRRVTPTAE
jgi:hypothetical protein